MKNLTHAASVLPSKAPLRLGDVIKSRENNFNAIRLALALLVLYSHSYAIVLGNGRFEPLRTTYGLTFGTIAVDAFFVISGLLVTRSLVTLDSAINFAWSRFLRVWPGLAVCTLMVAVVFGTVMSSLDAATYLGLRQTGEFVLRGLTLFLRVWTLPGVFASNPYGNEVNAPLWTLIVEVRLYLLIAGLWVIAQIFGERRRQAFTVLLVVLALVCILGHIRAVAGPVELSGWRVQSMFCIGMLCALFPGAIVLSGRAAFAMVVLSIVAAMVQRGPVFFLVYSATLWYAVLVMSYVPQGRLLIYNRAGDYSYGCYIYAWPVQQSVVSLWPTITVPVHIAVSGVVTLLLAAASWHLVEQHALKAKPRLNAVLARWR